MPISYTLAKNSSLTKLVEFVVFLLVKIVRLKNYLGKTEGSGTVIISLHKLGDSVFTIPSIREILKHWKNGVYLFCFEEAKPIFKMFFDEDMIIPFKHSDFYSNDRIAKRIVRKKLKDIDPCRIYDLTGSVRSATILMPSAANHIIGINESYFKSIYTDFTHKRTSPHIIDIYLDAISSIITHDRKSLKEFRSKVNVDGYLLIHPFAGWKAKEWNLNKFIDLAANLNKNFETILVTPPGMIAGDIANEILTAGIRLIETKNTDELLDVIKDCSLIISNDSGPVYMANIMGKPTFTIYGPTNPAFHIPYGKNHQFYQKTIQCSPHAGNKYCFTDAGRNGCPSFECMNLISTQELEKKLLEFIYSLGIKKKVFSE